MNKKTLFLIALVATTAASVDAFALDGYADRRGLYLSLGAHFGGGAMHRTIGDTTIHDKRRIDGGVSAGIGAGILQWITVGGEFAWTGQGISKQDLFLHQFNIMATSEFYVFHGLHLDIGAGVAISTTSGSGKDPANNPDAEYGFGLKIGAGYEHFVNGTVAIGGRFYYLNQFMEDARYDTFTAGVTLRWY